MKKALYMLLLIAEFVVGFGFLALATVATGWAYFLIVAAVWAIAMVLLIAKRKNVVDEAGRRKTKIAIALFMLIPLVSSVVGFTWLVSTTSW